MNIATMKKVLIEDLGGTESKDAVEVPADRKVSILVRFGDGVVPVAKVRSVRFAKGFVNIIGETEQFFVDTDCDFFVKAENGDKRNEARPGFH